jgi:hypothetical protein
LVVVAAVRRLLEMPELGLGVQEAVKVRVAPTQALGLLGKVIMEAHLTAHLVDMPLAVVEVKLPLGLTM